MAENGSEAIFGECKWRNEPADVDILETLQERSGLFHYQKQSYMIFSKSGFTEKLKLREQEEENVRLISFVRPFRSLVQLRGSPNASGLQAHDLFL